MITTIRDGMFPYAWRGGVITSISNDQRMDVAQRHKRCAICGDEKPLTHEKLSGGQKSYICEHCAIDYVLKAESVKDRYETQVKEEDTEQFTKLEIILPHDVFAEFRRMLDHYIWEEKLETVVQVKEVQ